MIAFDGKTPQIIEPGQMIHVRMREDRGIETADVFTQALHPKIRSGIDDPSGLWRLNVNRAAQTLVMRVRAAAHSAITANHRNTDGCAGAEKGKLHFHGVYSRCTLFDFLNRPINGAFVPAAVEGEG